MLDDTARTSFGIMLIQTKSMGTPESRIRFAELLMMITEAGLMANGLMDNYVEQRRNARELFSQMTVCIRTQGRPEFVNSAVTQLSQQIAMLLFPIVIAEGLAIINTDTFRAVNNEGEQLSGNLFGSRARR